MTSKGQSVGDKSSADLGTPSSAQPAELDHDDEQFQNRVLQSKILIIAGVLEKIAEDLRGEPTEAELQIAWHSLEVLVASFA